ncbi:hypothetical protein [Tautonia rosea]|uniref:hypothetical protein n=1 Tax=Tautonia rosea TaxID=2728037 RepID=UPI001472A2FE|nr:hypothetical protein [Tautonia rosea]
MTSLFTKLNLGQNREILVDGAPPGFEPELEALDGVTVHREPRVQAAIPFAMVFVKTLEDVEAATAWLPKASGDAVVWFAYPKASSKRFRCEFNRDTGWSALGDAGFEAVRQVSIDADWSALRFRRVEFIKSLTRDRSRAISPAGKDRVQSKKGDE